MFRAPHLASNPDYPSKSLSQKANEAPNCIMNYNYYSQYFNRENNFVELSRFKASLHQYLALTSSSSFVSITYAHIRVLMYWHVLQELLLIIILNQFEVSI